MKRHPTTSGKVVLAETRGDLLPPPTAPGHLPAGATSQERPTAERLTLTVGAPTSSVFDAFPGIEHADVLGGRYVVLGILGRGAIGMVYRAYDKSVGREVAVKVLRTANEGAQARLVEEARSMAKLAHPNVVRVYDVMPIGREHDRRVLLAMQHVKGCTLQQWLTCERTTHEILEIFRGAGEGLQAAHAVGLVHRDFKPANVLVAEDRTALVSDFGIASSWHDPQTLSSDLPALGQHGGATHHGAGLGTPWYMAPEQHVDAFLDPRADQYAFCVSLWEALSGTPLFGDVRDVPALLLRKHEPLPAFPRPDLVPAAVIAAVYRGLSLRPEDRHPSMAALLAALRTDAQQPLQTSRWLVATALASLGAFWGIHAWNEHLESSQRCSGARSHLRGVWDGERRERIATALHATGLPEAAATAARVRAALDRYADTWAREHYATCEATTILGEQPPHIMDLRMACLHRAKVDFAATTDLLVKADAGVLESTHRLLNHLPPLERCSDLEALQLDIPLPTTADADAVEDVRVELAEGHALIAAGKYEEARKSIVAADARAAKIGYAPLQTETLLALGDVHETLGALAESEAALEAALRSALRCKQQHEASRAALLLVGVVGASQMRAAEGLAYASIAQSLLLAGDQRTEGALRSNIGAVLHGEQRYTEAEAEYRVALRLWEQVYGTSDLRLTYIRTNIGNALRDQGRHAEAETTFREALELREKELGPEHPQVAIDRLNLGITLRMQGRLEQAQRELATALAVMMRRLGNAHPLLGTCHHNLAGVALDLHDLRTAESEATAAMELRRRLYGPDHVEVALSHELLGAVHLAAQRLDDAEVEYRRAVDMQIKLLGPQHPVLATTRTNLGRALIALGRFDAAEIELRAALAVHEKTLGERHPTVVQCRDLLSKVHDAQR